VRTRAINKTARPMTGRRTQADFMAEPYSLTAQ